MSVQTPPNEWIQVLNNLIEFLKIFGAAFIAFWASRYSTKKQYNLKIKELEIENEFKACEILYKTNIEKIKYQNEQMQVIVKNAMIIMTNFNIENAKLFIIMLQTNKEMIFHSLMQLEKQLTENNLFDDATKQILESGRAALNTNIVNASNEIIILVFSNIYKASNHLIVMNNIMLEQESKKMFTKFLKK